MDVSCTICTEVFTNESVTIATRCGHVFHHQCLAEWFKKANTCPQCNHACNGAASIRLFLNITPQNPLDSLQLLDNLKQSIQAELIQRNKSNEEFAAKLKQAEVSKENLKLQFQTQLKVEEEIRLQMNEKLKTVEKTSQTAVKSPRSKPYKIPEKKPRVWNAAENSLNLSDLPTTIYLQPSTSIGVNALGQPSTSNASQWKQNNTSKMKSDMVSKWVLQHGQTGTDFQILPSQQQNPTPIKLELPEATDDVASVPSQQNHPMAATNPMDYVGFPHQQTWNPWNSLPTDAALFHLLDL